MTAAASKTRKGAGISSASDAALGQPGSNWLPIGRAPFYFLPKYTPPGDLWKEQIEAVLQRIGGVHTVKCVGPDVAEIRLQHLQLTIDAADGEFAFERIGEDDFGGARGAPLDVLDCAVFREEPDEDHTLRALGRSVWAYMVAAFESAVEAGEVRLMAQPGSVLADFRPIHPHQTKLFTFSNESRDETGAVRPATASGPGGVTLYCPFIIPPTSERRSAKSDENIKIADWFISKKSGHRNLTKEALFDSAKIEWGHISNVRLKNIWKDASRKAPDLPWSKRGPKRK